MRPLLSRVTPDTWLVGKFVIGGPAFAMRPERTARARRPLGVVNTLFVWTPNHAIHHGNRLRAVCSNELKNILDDLVIVSHIARFGKPAFKCDNLFVLDGNNPYTHLRCDFVVRPIKRNGGHGIAGKTTACFLPQRYLVAFSKSHDARSIANVPVQPRAQATLA